MHERIPREILYLKRQIFYDEKHGNYQFLVNGLALSFKLIPNDKKPSFSS